MQPLHYHYVVLYYYYCYHYYNYTNLGLYRMLPAYALCIESGVHLRCSSPRKSAPSTRGLHDCNRRRIV